MAEDKELERIKLKTLREMLGLNASKEKEKLVKDREPSVFSKPVEVTDATLMEVVEKNPLVVVDCWAPWCGPCQFVGPIIEELARDYAGKVLFGKLNVDENPLTATQYQIMGIPTLLVFKNGKLADRIIGAMPREMLEPRIARYLKS
jgi:thioredoxin 1